MIRPVAMTVFPEYQRIRVPREHGRAWIEPSFDDLDMLLGANQERLQAWDGELQGRPLRELRQSARQELIEQARAYTSAYRDVEQPPDSGNAPLVLAGHQPQLFHAGVWFKNFVLSSLGRQCGATTVNLLIDNDVLRSAAIRVPTREAEGLRVQSLPFDGGQEGIPYEQRLIRDAACFATFGDRVAAALGDIEPAPLVREYWPLVREAAQRTRNLGRCLAEARHRIEGRWHQQTLEVPLSIVCGSAAFAWFTAHLLAHLPRFQAIYNASLAEYRRVNRIRSRSHPVPELAEAGPWLEAPFWIWTADDPRRRRLWVRDQGDGLEVTDREGCAFTLPLTPDSEADRAVECLLAAAGRGIRVRPRALVTTMYARLVLSDLFLHGLGGAKYDQLTDLIVQRFFGLQPPAFATLSATALLLPDRTPQWREELQRTRTWLRELRYAPERHAPRTPEVERWLADKRHWLDQSPPRGQRRARHREIERVNLALQPWLSAQRDAWTDRLRVATDELRRQTALASREFAFCLFSEHRLRPLLLELSRQMP